MELSTSAALEHIQDAVEAVRGRSGVQPRVGVMLGTGLGGLTSEIEVETEISYEDIAHFPVSTVESHTGKLILGTLEGVPIVAMQGRFHRYEGYSLAEVTFPVRVMGSLGIESLIVCAAAGGMNPLWELGDLVLVEDHINLLGENPLTGPNIDDLGPRFPDMSEPYDAGLRELALSTAKALQIPLPLGICQYKNPAPARARTAPPRARGSNRRSQAFSTRTTYRGMSAVKSATTCPWPGPSSPYDRM